MRNALSALRGAVQEINAVLLTEDEGSDNENKLYEDENSKILPWSQQKELELQQLRRLAKLQEERHRFLVRQLRQAESDIFEYSSRLFSLKPQRMLCRQFSLTSCNHSETESCKEYIKKSSTFPPTNHFFESLSRGTDDERLWNIIMKISEMLQIDVFYKESSMIYDRDTLDKNIQHASETDFRIMSGKIEVSNKCDISTVKDTQSIPAILESWLFALDRLNDKSKWLLGEWTSLKATQNFQNLVSFHLCPYITPDQKEWLTPVKDDFDFQSIKTTSFDISRDYAGRDDANSGSECFVPTDSFHLLQEMTSKLIEMILSLVASMSSSVSEKHYVRFQEKHQNPHNENLTKAESADKIFKNQKRQPSGWNKEQQQHDASTLKCSKTLSERELMMHDDSICYKNTKSVTKECDQSLFECCGLGETSTNIQILEQENRDLRLQLKFWEDAHADVTGALQAANAEVAEHRRKSSRLEFLEREEQEARLNVDLVNSLQETLSKSEEDIRCIVATKNSIQKDLDEAKIAVERLNKAMKITQIDHENVVNDLSKEIENLQSENLLLTRQMEEVKIATTDMTNLRRKCSEKDQMNLELLKHQEKLTEENKLLKDRIEQLYEKMNVEQQDRGYLVDRRVISQMIRKHNEKDGETKTRNQIFMLICEALGLSEDDKRAIGICSENLKDEKGLSEQFLEFLNKETSS